MTQKRYLDIFVNEAKKEVSAWPYRAKIFLAAAFFLAASGWAGVALQRQKSRSLRQQHVKLQNEFDKARKKFGEVFRRYELLQAAADRHYPEAEGPQALSKLIADVKKAKHLGAKKKFVRRHAKLRYRVMQPSQQAIVKHGGIPIEFLVIARRGDPELLKAAETFAAILKKAGLTARIAEADEKDSEPPGVRIYVNKQDERFLPSLVPAVKRYFQGPYMAARSA
ncbi:MAG: hypothetical protein GY844_14850, partial [Bradyrhizobium sp.]|nr:hypothetical protein [Bradyrhizobium sp.]